MTIDLMGFTADLAHEIRRQHGHVTKLTTSESDAPQYPHCYHVRVEDGVRWTEYWVTHVGYSAAPPMDRIAEYLLYRLKNGDPITMHVPKRLTEARDDGEQGGV